MVFASHRASMPLLFHFTLLPRSQHWRATHSPSQQSPARCDQTGPHQRPNPQRTVQLIDQTGLTHSTVETATATSDAQRAWICRDLPNTNLPFARSWTTEVQISREESRRGPQEAKIVEIKEMVRPMIDDPQST
jgi:hypothetical protein